MFHQKSISDRSILIIRSFAPAPPSPPPSVALRWVCLFVYLCVYQSVCLSICFIECAVDQHYTLYLCVSVSMLCVIDRQSDTIRWAKNLMHKTNVRTYILLNDQLFHCFILLFGIGMCTNFVSAFITLQFHLKWLNDPAPSAQRILRIFFSPSLFFSLLPPTSHLYWSVRLSFSSIFLCICLFDNFNQMSIVHSEAENKGVTLKCY